VCVAIFLGLSHTFQDDHTRLAQGRVIFHAL
jgi:hypothetical protein